MAFRSRNLMVDGCDESRYDGNEALSEVLKVSGLGRRSDQLIDDGQEIVERGDGCQGLCMAGSSSPSGHGEQEGGVDDFQGNPAIEQTRSEPSVGATGDAGGSGHSAIELEDALGVALSGREAHDFSS